MRSSGSSGTIAVRARDRNFRAFADLFLHENRNINENTPYEASEFLGVWASNTTPETAEDLRPHIASNVNGIVNGSRHKGAHHHDSTDAITLPPSVNATFETLWSLSASQAQVINGIIPVVEEYCFICYKLRNDEVVKLDLDDSPTEDDLAKLRDACTRATLFRDNVEVLDETYMNAGSMHGERFATTIQPWNHLRQVNDSIGGGREFSIECARLNTYGIGEFSKGVTGGTVSEESFGSLVIVLPVAHRGGGAVLRYQGEEWQIDHSPRTLPAATPGNIHVGLMAFSREVEYEVLPVTSGCRVTITYDLVWANDGQIQLIRPISDTRDERQRSALDAILHNPEYLPDGGILGFYLEHQYPFARGADEDTKNIISQLKGSDRALYDLFSEHSLQYDVKLVMETALAFGADFTFLCDRIADLQQVDSEELFYIIKNDGGVYVLPDCSMDDYEHYAKRSKMEIVGPVLWVTQPIATNTLTEPYIMYGSQSEAAYARYQVCFILKLGKPGSREKYPIRGHRPRS